MRAVFAVAIGAIVAMAWHASELGHSGQSKWDTAQTLVYRDSAAFRGAWTQLYPIASMRPALPAIDFTKYRVLIVAAGNRPTGGFRMALSEGHLAGDTALVTVTMFTPPAGCGVTQEITTPAIAIATPKFPASFRIITRTRADTVRCN